MNILEEEQHSVAAHFRERSKTFFDFIYDTVHRINSLLTFMHSTKHAQKSATLPKLAARVSKKLIEQSQKPALAVVGLGYVGLPLALLAEQNGFRVIGLEADEQKVDSLQQRKSPVLSEEEARYFTKSQLQVGTDASALQSASVVIVCVPTPVGEKNLPDLSALISASEAVGKNLQKGTVVIIESTVNPGVCEEVVLPILVKHSGLEPEKDFYFAHCPERINPGDTRWTTANIPRVIGANSPASLARAMSVYESILEAKLHPMHSIKEAEAVKMVENSFRDINIAFVNELAMSFSRMNIDVVHVIDAARSKPFAFMAHYPGCGVGGHCIPVDPYYLIEHARKNGFDHRFLKTARDINSNMPHFTVSLLTDALAQQGKKLAGSRIALLGLSYKADIADVRESPALEILHELRAHGAGVSVFDPNTKDAPEVTAHTMDEALTGAQAVVLATNHKEFSSLSPEQLRKHGITILIDGRNMLDKDAFLASGITYKGIGR